MKPARQEGWHPEEKKHRRREGRYWLTSLLLSLAVAIGAGFSARYAFKAASEAHEQAVQARRQADEAGRQVGIAAQALVATDRPWIKIISVSDPKLEISTQYGYVSFGITVKVSNVGRSPAGSVTIDSKLLTPWSDKPWVGPDGSAPVEVKAFCHGVEGQPESIFFESLLFPGDEDPREASASLTTNDIRAARDAAIRGSYLGWLGVPRQDREKLDTMAQELATPTISSFILIGCVTYRIPSGQALGQTSFIYEVDRRECRDDPAKCGGFDITRPALYSDADLSVKPAGGGTYAK